MVKRQNHDANVGCWGHGLLDLCHDDGLFILNGRTPGDKSGEFIFLVDGGCNTIDYIVGSPAVWQVVTHFEMIIDDIRYCVVGGDFDHKALHVRLNINCSFVEPQHAIETKQNLP